MINKDYSIKFKFIFCIIWVQILFLQKTNATSLQVSQVIDSLKMLDVDIMVYFKGKHAFDADINIFREDIPFKYLKSNKKGRAKVCLHPDHIYKFKFSFQDLIPVEVIFNTFNVKPNIKFNKHYYFPVAFEFTDSTDAIQTYELLNIPMAKIYFNSKLDKFEADMEFTDRSIKEFDGLSMETRIMLFKAAKDRIQATKKLANYQVKEKELVEAQSKYKELEIENTKNTKNAFLGLAVFIAIVSLLLLRAYFIKKNSNTKLHKQNELIAEQKQEITDSIQYAQRIQFAILPTKENILKAFPQSFILFKPKDIVSGDFYWFQEVDNKKYIAACDCTGHGVPGALMSMVATDMLNDALVHTKKVDEILAITNRSIKTALKQSNDDDSTRDGMDIALCCFDDKTNLLKYAGAYRPLWLIRNSAQNSNTKNGYELIEYKATKAAIGGLTEDNQMFQINEIQLQKGDTIYLSSDGYADQFSPADKKLMTKRFKEILLSIQHLTMTEQGRYLDNFINEWRGIMEQTDDVLVIGVRV